MMRSFAWLFTPLLLYTCGDGNQPQSSPAMDSNTTEKPAHVMALEEGMKVTVTGRALNAKAGAVIHAQDGQIYYIDELTHWSDTIYSKTLEVTGVLHIQTFTEDDLKDENGDWKQGMLGTQLTVMDARWRVVE
jgi:hypothetical protein